MRPPVICRLAGSYSYTEHPGTFHGHTRSGFPGEGSCVFGLEAPLHDHHIAPEDHVLCDMPIARKRSNEWPDEVLLHSLFPAHGRPCEQEQYVIRVVAHDGVDVGALPCAEILGDERLYLVHG
jgi:hypothetical protein